MREVFRPATARAPTSISYVAIECDIEGGAIHAALPSGHDFHWLSPTIAKSAWFVDARSTGTNKHSVIESTCMQPAEVAQLMLMYFVLPLWLLAGFADYLCHRASDIEHTSGAKESLLHLLLFAEMGVPVLAAIFLEINALIIAVMIVCFLLHEATSLWDVSYAAKLRNITPIEQHVHSLLEMLPLMGLLLIIVTHWGQFLALLGLGTEPASFALAFKRNPLPWPYVLTVLAAVALFEVLPFVEELIRGLRANAGALVPRPTSRAGKRPRT